MDINTESVKELTPLVEKVLIHSQAYPFEHLQLYELMNTWRKNKDYYIKLFGGKPILVSDKKITIVLTEAAKERKFEAMMDMLGDIVDIESKADNGLTLGDFLEENKDGFFQNEVIESHPEIKIKKGMKQLKCFKYFLPSFTETRNAQDLASRFIQDSKIEGYLYLSVHPLDFLTLSESNSNWRSCQALDGDYRSGNLSYMVDDTTLIAYLADGSTKHLRALPDDVLWLDKKWRMLVHTNNFKSVIYYNRQYPFDSDELEMEVYKAINETLCNGAFRKPNHNGFSTVRIPGWEESLDLDHNFILGAEDCIYDTRDTINDKEFLGYCDLIYSPHFSPVTSIMIENPYTTFIEESCVDKKKIWDKKFHSVYDIKIGGKVPCVKCGRNHVKRNDSFLCDECIATEDADEDYYLVCNTCGSRIYNIKDAVVIDGEFVCKTCASAINKERQGDI